VVPQALLYRDMRFADLARMQVFGSIAGAVVAIAMAWAGAGVWALVVQPLVGSTVGLAIAVAALRWRPFVEFSWLRVQPLARFSFALLGTNLVDYANRNVDTLLIGRVLGAAALGLYSMAIQLMLYPLQQVSSVIVRVLFPTLVQIGDDLPRLRAAYLKAVGAIALVTFPMTGGLFAVADELVAVVLGADWTGMAPVLKIVAWVGMLQSVGTTVGTIYIAVGKPQIALRVTMIATPVLTLAFAAGLPWGIVGVAVGYAVASALLFYYTMHRAFALIDLRMQAMHAVIAKPFAATLAMIVVVFVAGAACADATEPIRLAVKVASGVAAYVLACLLVNRAQILEIIAVFRSLRPSGRT
jgi:PST family polysaccharide transporter